MRSAISGDSAAYYRLLKAVTPVLLARSRRCGLARSGQPPDQLEEIVQEILKAVHLKRHTWDVERPVLQAWLFAIACNKLIDALRRRGWRIFVDIRRFRRDASGRSAVPRNAASASEVAAQFQTLPAQQHDVLQLIAVESASIKDTGGEIFDERRRGVRVALHRGLDQPDGEVT